MGWSRAGDCGHSFLPLELEALPQTARSRAGHRLAAIFVSLVGSNDVPKADSIIIVEARFERNTMLNTSCPLIRKHGR